MHFSSVVIKRIFLEAKVTRQVHSNPTEIFFGVVELWLSDITQGLVSQSLHRWTLICRPVKHSRTHPCLIRADFQNRADERKRDKDTRLYQMTSVNEISKRLLICHRVTI